MSFLLGCIRDIFYSDFHEKFALEVKKNRKMIHIKNKFLKKTDLDIVQIMRIK
jgi:hypothetical protein